MSSANQLGQRQTHASLRTANPTWPRKQQIGRKSLTSDHLSSAIICNDLRSNCTILPHHSYLKTATAYWAEKTKLKFVIKMIKQRLRSLEMTLATYNLPCYMAGSFHRRLDQAFGPCWRRTYCIGTLPLSITSTSLN